MTEFLDLIDAVRSRNFAALDEIQKRSENGLWSGVPLPMDGLRTGSYVAEIVCLIEEADRQIAGSALEAERQFLETGRYPASLDDFPADLPVLDLTDPDRRPLSDRLGKSGRPQINYAEWEGGENPAWRYDQAPETNRSCGTNFNFSGFALAPFSR